MQNFMKTILSAVKTWTKGKIKDSTADWNENDSNADSYVKNRTHYEEKTEKKFIFLNEVTISVSEYDGHYGFYDSYNQELVIGQKYTVIIDGEVFKDLICFDDDGYPTLGAPWQNYSEYHFCLCTWVESDQIMLAFYTDSAEDSHTISVTYTTTETVVHKLDSKYLNLPTNLATTDEVQSAKQEALDAASAAQTTAETAQTTADTAVANAATAQATADSKMNATNPTGSGKISVGTFNTAIGNNSQTFGLGTQNYCENLNVFGKYNVAEKYILKKTNYSDQYNIRLSSSDRFYYSDTYSYDPTTNILTLIDPVYATAGSLQIALANGNVGQYYFVATPNSISGTTLYCTHQNSQWGVGSGANTGPILYAYSTLTLVTTSTSMDGKYAHIVGNGTSDTARSNAHTLDWEGNAWYQGDVYVGSTSGTNMDEGSKKLATEEYVDTSIANLVDSAPETLNTLNELATAIQEHQEVTDVLDAAVINKQDKITGTPGQFVIIGDDGNITTKTILYAEGVSF